MLKSCLLMTLFILKFVFPSFRSRNPEESAFFLHCAFRRRGEEMFVEECSALGTALCDTILKIRLNVEITVIW